MAIKNSLDYISEETNEETKEEETEQETLCDEIRDKGNWEKGIEILNPIKRKEQVSIFKKLSNGLTPYEIMYGKQDNDFAYQFD
jgi:hypothetical protein